MGDCRKRNIINEGKKANIIKIDFVGNEHISAKDLRQVMKTKEKGWLTWITKSGRIDREQVEDDLAELVTYYRNKGYLRVKLDKVEYFDQFRHLHFRSSPGEFHVGFNTLFLKPAFRDAHAFRGDALALKVFRTGNGGIFRDYQHPAGRLEDLNGLRVRI